MYIMHDKLVEFWRKHFFLSLLFTSRAKLYLAFVYSIFSVASAKKMNLIKIKLIYTQNKRKNNDDKVLKMYPKTELGKKLYMCVYRHFMYNSDSI